jgi:hypothetical protein
MMTRADALALQAEIDEILTAAADEPAVVRSKLGVVKWG